MVAVQVMVTVEIKGRYGGYEGTNRLRRDCLERARNVRVFEIQETRQRLLQEVEVKISIRVEVQNRNQRRVEIVGIHVRQDQRGEVIISHQREGERKVETLRQKREERVNSIKTEEEGRGIEGKKEGMAVAQALMINRGEKEGEKKRRLW